MAVQFSYDLVGNVDDFCWFVGLPVCVIVFLFYEKSNIVDETCQDLLLFTIPSHYSQEVACHILTWLCTITELVLTAILNFSVHYGLLELFHTVVVRYWLILVCILTSLWVTLVGRRGLPRALSVLGLMSAPGGCIVYGLLCPNVFVWREWRVQGRRDTICRMDIQIYVMLLLWLWLSVNGWLHFTPRSLIL